jgi:molybdenum cofactor biosynthesis enzyme MoaA
MATVKIFDTEVPVKEWSCSLNGEMHEPIKPYFNLYVRVTDSCQASCKFCVYHSASQRHFDAKKFNEILKYLKAHRVRLNKASLTGGEPAINPTHQKAIVDLLKLSYPKIHTTINTNGINLDQTLKTNVKCISLSRHHYDDDANSKIFGTNTVPTSEQLRSIERKDFVHLRCNLIQGQIFTQEKILEYIDWGAELGFSDFGFVSLMKVNPYCEANFIDHSICQFETAPNTKLVYYQSDTASCNCKNFLHFTERGEIVKVYSRVNGTYTECESTLVYDVDVLRAGFSGPVLA